MDARVITPRVRRLSGLIAELGITRTALALFLQVERRTVQRWLSGTQDYPHHVLVLLTIMVRLKLTVDDVDKMMRKERVADRSKSGADAPVCDG